jgi:hypothetical protein
MSVGESSPVGRSSDRSRPGKSGPNKSGPGRSGPGRSGPSKSGLSRSRRGRSGDLKSPEATSPMPASVVSSASDPTVPSALSTKRSTGRLVTRSALGPRSEVVGGRSTCATGVSFREAMSGSGGAPSPVPASRVGLSEHPCRLLAHAFTAAGWSRLMHPVQRSPGTRKTRWEMRGPARKPWAKNFMAGLGGYHRSDSRSQFGSCHLAHRVWQARIFSTGCDRRLRYAGKCMCNAPRPRSLATEEMMLLLTSSPTSGLSVRLLNKRSGCIPRWVMASSRAARNAPVATGPSPLQRAVPAPIATLPMAVARPNANSARRAEIASETVPNNATWAGTIVRPAMSAARHARAFPSLTRLVLRSRHRSGHLRGICGVVFPCSAGQCGYYPVRA